MIDGLFLINLIKGPALVGLQLSEPRNRNSRFDYVWIICTRL